jgi:hypothetical protein
MSPKVPPQVEAVAREIGAGLVKLGYRVISAAVAEGLKAAGELTGEVDARVKRGHVAARKMANGEPYDPDADEEDESDIKVEYEPAPRRKR